MPVQDVISLHAAALEKACAATAPNAEAPRMSGYAFSPNTAALTKARSVQSKEEALPRAHVVRAGVSERPRRFRISYPLETPR